MDRLWQIHWVGKPSLKPWYIHNPHTTLLLEIMFTLRFTELNVPFYCRTKLSWSQERHGCSQHWITWLWHLTGLCLVILSRGLTLVRHAGIGKNQRKISEGASSDCEHEFSLLLCAHISFPLLLMMLCMMGSFVILHCVIIIYQCWSIIIDGAYLPGRMSLWCKFSLVFSRTSSLSRDCMQTRYVRAHVIIDRDHGVTVTYWTSIGASLSRRWLRFDKRIPRFELPGVGGTTTTGIP